GNVSKFSKQKLPLQVLDHGWDNSSRDSSTAVMHKPPLSCVASTHIRVPDVTHHNKLHTVRQIGVKPTLVRSSIAPLATEN
ncbi:hypothetical protein A2U01_0088939, partial [Trifolium medium]|nr:hypothetical protein [Trifolium medium]